MQMSHQATSLGGAGPDPPQSVVDYAIASRAAAPWVTGVTVGDAWLTLSDHCPLMLSLALPPPQHHRALHYPLCMLAGNRVHRHAGMHTSAPHFS